MPEPLLFCRMCLAWSEPILDGCPTCGSPLEMEEADINLEELIDRTGRLVADLGPATLMRSVLPSEGSLVALEQGLLFVPRVSLHPKGGWVATGASRSVIESWGRRLTRRLGSLWPSGGVEAVEEGSLLPEGEPIDWIRDLPGTLVVELRTVRRVRLRRKTLSVERTPWRTISFELVACEATSRALMALTELPSWQAALDRR